ncbi:hypothetical protein HHK36_031313 [Tetracentron sinense]|uniref:GATA-type domain-containing protein n=1 Tax=Tetracentron sinense TaxID=13715 RepID=A0A834YES3_TETSI|nr:hypothetical protein HHK36_031313 [Tetracentron sinense]
MNRCNSSHGNKVVPSCSCSLFHDTRSNSFSMLFSMPKSFDEAHHEYSITSSSSSVDCTLSLGTPSSRRTEDVSIMGHERRRSGSNMSNLGWDIDQTTQPPSTTTTVVEAHRSNRGGASRNNSLMVDPLLARRCANCDTTSTPLWRNGPRGPKSLCNACGIRYKKEERRATTAAAASVMEPQHLMSHRYHHYNHSWTHHEQTHTIPSTSPAIGSEFRFNEEDDRESDTGIPFLLWRVNVPDRPSLVPDFT